MGMGQALCVECGLLDEWKSGSAKMKGRRGMQRVGVCVSER